MNVSNVTDRNGQLSYHFSILDTLSDACISVSIVALAFLLVTYCLFSELRTPPGINVMNLSASLLLAQLLWVTTSDKTDHSMACTVTAVLLHYLLLVSFVWTAIIAFDTWKTVTSKVRVSQANSKHKRIKRCIKVAAIAWTSAMVYVAICIALDQSGTVSIEYGSPHDVCWITDNNAKLYFFGIPVGLVLIFNAVFYSMTVKAIRTTRNRVRFAASYRDKKRTFGIYVKMGTLMGFTWILGISRPNGSDWLFLAYIFVVLNGLQGVYMAIAFALSGPARKLYLDLIREKILPKKEEEEIKV